MFDLTHFRLEDMVRCGADLRSIGEGTSQTAEVATRIVRYFYDKLRDGSNDARACTLVRLYKTHPFGDLEPNLQRVARAGLGDREPTRSVKCLTLLATAGDEEAWNSPQRSAGHQVIPLFSKEQIESIPMVAQLIRQFGLDTGSVLAPDRDIMLDWEQRTYNVFHVLQASGSPFIPAQADFVVPFGIASVLGFGGVLPSSELVAVILFSKVTIPAGTAEFFRTVALNLKLALMPHERVAAVASDGLQPPIFDRLDDPRIAALAQLVDVQEQTALVQIQLAQSKNKELEVALQQLRTAQAELVAKERLASLGALTAGIAHEIKNPLNFVTNFAHLSIDLVAEFAEELEQRYDRFDDATRTNFIDLLADLKLNAQKIQEHGKRADGIVHTMLQHSRGEAARHSPTDLNELLTRYTDLAYHGLRAQDPTLQITLQTEFDPTIGKVDVISEQLSRVILNLVNNACYAASKKRTGQSSAFRPTVRVSSEARGENVEIRIRDNGDGVPVAIRDRIFDPFFTTKPPGAGTGLGLSLSHDIVVGEHRGAIRVESIEGEGAEFIITIPRKTAVESARS